MCIRPSICAHSDSSSRLVVNISLSLSLSFPLSLPPPPPASVPSVSPSPALSSLRPSPFSVCPSASPTPDVCAAVVCVCHGAHYVQSHRSLGCILFPLWERDPGSPRSGGESTTTPEGPQALAGALAGLTWRRELEAWWYLHGQRDGTATAPSVDPGTLKSAVDDLGHVGGWVSRWEMARDAFLAHVVVHTCMHKHAHVLPTHAYPHCTCNPSGGLETLGLVLLTFVMVWSKTISPASAWRYSLPLPGHRRPSAGLRGAFKLKSCV